MEDVTRQLILARLSWSLPNDQNTVALWAPAYAAGCTPGAADLSASDSRSGTITEYWSEPGRFGLDVNHRMAQ